MLLNIFCGNRDSLVNLKFIYLKQNAFTATDTMCACVSVLFKNNSKKGEFLMGLLFI